MSRLCQVSCNWRGVAVLERNLVGCLVAHYVGMVEVSEAAFLKQLVLHIRLLENKLINFVLAAEAHSTD